MTQTQSNRQPAAAFQLKGSIYTLTTLELHSPSVDDLAEQLASMADKAPSFFQQTPVIIALDQLRNDRAFNVSRAKHLLHEAGMVLVAIRGGSQHQKKEAGIANIAWLPAQKAEKQSNVVMLADPDKNVDIESIDPQESSFPKPVATKIITTPVRSGQQVFSEGDLIVMAPVSAGAELLAGGSIHIYGPLRGRALAGINSTDSDARIYATRFEAELVSICGQYKLTCQPDHSPWSELWGQSACVMRETGHLRIRAL
ncbi:septum site-determining protein MinC [Endozoicomonas sp. OPT23]|uniref:septum site-determining protein MinC n=1 Tax=Endozoicomonas sp. OPT23 TaxID=2072845 RepID=UPI00129BB301|nr:septum site-determining protein MinC [Endozoicomonas sp. OPT23]MRI34609.1 septum site-determining protein MinC [Endozoicomonas sp. OPT23]